MTLQGPPALIFTMRIFSGSMAALRHDFRAAVSRAIARFPTVIFVTSTTLFPPDAFG
jgi:hypothetical protein